MQEQISGKSPRFSQSLEECALSTLLLSGHCFRRDPATSHHFPEERNVVWHSAAKENSHLLHQETSARWQHQCHQFGAFAALAAVDIEADGTLLNVHIFLAQCLHIMVINPQFSEQWIGQHIIQREKTSNMRRLCHMLPLKSHLPIALVVALLFRKKNLCVEECDLCTLVCVCVCVCWSFICNAVGVGNRIWGAGWVGLQDVSRRS